MNNSKEIFSLIQGYQKSALLFSINSLPDNERLMQLMRYYPNEYLELSNLDKFINYHTFNYDLWKSIGYSMKTNIPVVKSHSDLNLEDYLIGLNQRNRLAWKDCDYQDIFGFVKDKTVLDFGCGGCFYSDIFSSMANKVYCYDKPDVISFVKEKIILREDKCSVIDDLEFLSYTNVDIIWISEVIHGKGIDEVKDLLHFLKGYLKEGGIIVINELHPNTPLGELFDLQMKLHTKNGKLYKCDEIIKLFNKITLVKMSKYHLIIGGEV